MFSELKKVKKNTEVHSLGVPQLFDSVLELASLAINESTDYTGVQSVDSLQL